MFLSSGVSICAQYQCKNILNWNMFLRFPNESNETRVELGGARPNHWRNYHNVYIHYFSVVTPPAFVIMMVADILVQNKHQIIANHIMLTRIRLSICWVPGITMGNRNGSWRIVLLRKWFCIMLCTFDIRRPGYVNTKVADVLSP